MAGGGAAAYPAGMAPAPLPDPAAEAGSPPPAPRLRAPLLRQALRFGLVGASGVVVDAAALHLALALGAGLYGGRVFSYLVAASSNWALNRAWTFAEARHRPAGRQWALFLLVNAAGFACNYGTYALLVATLPWVAAYPALGVAAGALAGMAGNFLLSRRYVFPPA